MRRSTMFVAVCATLLVDACSSSGTTPAQSARATSSTQAARSAVGSSSPAGLPADAQWLQLDSSNVRVAVPHTWHVSSSSSYVRAGPADSQSRVLVSLGAISNFRGDFTAENLRVAMNGIVTPTDLTSGTTATGDVFYGTGMIVTSSDRDLPGHVIVGRNGSTGYLLVVAGTDSAAVSEQFELAKRTVSWIRASS